MAEFTKQDEKLTDSFTAQEHLPLQVPLHCCPPCHRRSMTSQPALLCCMQANIAVRNAQLYDERKQSEQRMQSLVDMVHDLTGESDPPCPALPT